MKTSVIIPARNASATMEACLKGVRAALAEDAEVIVIDDHSSDATVEIAKQYADHVESLPAHGGLANARNVGKKLARGKRIVFIDSDVVVPKDAFFKIEHFFETRPDIYALTGLLSKEHPNADFFSQYKNLYMHYIFKNQHNPIRFLYGSIHAFREKPTLDYDVSMHYAEDTAMGMALSREGKEVILLKDLEVIHLKRHNFWSLTRNDFNIPFYWARLFIQSQGWKGILKHSKSFAHAPLWQLGGVAVSAMLLLFALSALVLSQPWIAWWSAVCFFGWGTCNAKLFLFFLKEKGFLFCVQSTFWTLWDQWVMAAGIAAGILKSFWLVR